ncbi:MAG: hypothetical protein D6690_07925, partial [Nitrospirae bacterium]
MNVLAIQDGHNASCVYLEDGEVRLAVQEERLRREKNFHGFPLQGIEFIEKESGVKASEMDRIVLASSYVPSPPPGGREARIRAYKKDPAKSRVKEGLKQLGVKRAVAAGQIQKRKNILAQMGCEQSKIEVMDHHFCHAASAYYGWGKYDEDVLVLTNDGAGDDLCATVSIGSRGRLKRIAEVRMEHSIGELWALFTAMMGMVPLEHEYKLMGLAPYAPESGVERVKRVLEDCFTFESDGLTWRVAGGCPP